MQSNPAYGILFHSSMFENYIYIFNRPFASTQKRKYDVKKQLSAKILVRNVPFQAAEKEVRELFRYVLLFFLFIYFFNCLKCFEQIK